jgi:TolB protein
VREEIVLTQATRSRGMRVLLLGIVLALAVSCISILLASPKEAEASFPGKNGLLAFSRLDGDVEIYTSYLDGSSLNQRTNAEGFSGEPDWSADGTKIAFASTRDGNSEIYVKDITTGKTSQLTDDIDPEGSVGAALELGEPQWSPDGTKIAFNGGYISGELFCSPVFVMNADGSDVKTLIGGCNQTILEDWSPDGSAIAFNIIDRNCHNPDIWVLKLDALEPTSFTNITNTCEHNEYEVDWKPNGKKMTFSRDNDVWKMNPDGSQKDRLTFSGGLAPIWSPNARKILFYSCCGGSVEGQMMNVDGTNKTKVPGLANTSLADWQPIPTP